MEMRKSIQQRNRVAVLALIFAWFLFAELKPLTALAQSTATLAVRVTGARNAKGQIAVALFRDDAGFPSDGSRAFRVRQAAIDGQTSGSEVVFEGIPQGVYAVSVFHDENM